MKLGLVCGLILLCFGAFAQTSKPDDTGDYAVTHYTKYEYRIPMRDGKRLFTAVYVPKDTSRSYPILMSRTCYNVAPYGVDEYKKHLGPSDEFEKSGYIFVYQDVRGRFMSEGEWLEMTPHIDNKTSPKQVDESSDAYDTIEYLLKHVRNNNGKVGLWGISYPGFYTSASIIDSHPAIKAASPQAPVTDLYMNDDAYHGGAFMLSANFSFYTSFRPILHPSKPPKHDAHFDYGTPDSYQYYLNAGPIANLDKIALDGQNPYFSDGLYHTVYDDYWKARAIAPHLHNIKCAVLVVGGWFDAEDLAGPFDTLNAIDKFNPGATNTLVMGPWVHGGWSRTDGDRLGDVNFGSKTGEFFRQNIQFPFFEHYLKGAAADALPKAYVFETGSNVWRKYEAWPPAKVKTQPLYLHGKGKLSFEPPEAAEGFDEYTSDPSHPVPFTGYTTNTVPQRYMIDDQRFASKRPDVVTYQTEPLEEDITVAGPPAPHLNVSTTGTDSDFVVKLIDVYPPDFPGDDSDDDDDKHVTGTPSVLMGNYQQLVRGEPQRGKFRNGFGKPQAFTPGKITEVDFKMQDVNHVFRRGHRIMVQIQSSWFPLIDRNPQTFVDIPNAKPADFKIATERVYHNAAAVSSIELPVLPQ